MALGAKLIAATLILGASTVGTYAIANGGLGGLSSEGDSSTSNAEETGTQKAVPEAPADAGETGVRAEPSAAVPPKTQPQPAQESVPETKESGAVVDNQVAQGNKEERIEGAAATLPGSSQEESSREESPAPAEVPGKSETALEPKEGGQDQDPKVVSNVEAEVASDTGHNSAGATVQQPDGDQGNNLGDTSHVAVPASDENQHRNTNADGGDQSNPVTKQAGDNDDPSKGNQVEVTQVPDNTDPNKDASGGKGAEQQDKGTSPQLETTSPEVGTSLTPQNSENNKQEGVQDNHNTPGN